MKLGKRTVTFMLSLLTVTLVLCILAPSAVWGYDYWGEDDTISDDVNMAMYPVAAIDGENAVSVWPQSRIYSNYSDDAGLTWSSPQAIDNEDAGEAVLYYPSVAISGLHVTAVWAQPNTSTDSGNSILCNYSSDGGATWNDSAVLIKDGSLEDTQNPQVTIDGQNAVIIWQQWPGLSHNAMPSFCISYSTDYGAHWSAPQTIGNPVFTSSQPIRPRIQISGENVVAVWNQYLSHTDSRVFSSYSSDHGVNWSTPVDLYGQMAFSPELALSGANVLVFWGNGAGNIYYRHSADYGVTWEDFQQMGGNDAGSYRVSIDGEHAVAVWSVYVYPDDYYLIYYAFSSDGGSTWSSPQSITTPDFSAESLLVGLAGFDSVIVWSQMVDYVNRMCCNYSDNYGENFGEYKLIENNSDVSAYNACLAISTSGIVVVWDTGMSDIYTNNSEFDHPPAVVGGEVTDVPKSALWIILIGVAGLLLTVGIYLVNLRRRSV